MMKYVRGRDVRADTVIPVPSDWLFSKNGKQRQLDFPKRDAARFRVVYGFLGAMSGAPDMEDTCTPLHLQVIAKLWYKFGKKAAEKHWSHIFVRINAFSPRACLDKSFEALTLGAPIRGILEITDSHYGSAQLIGCTSTPGHT